MKWVKVLNKISIFHKSALTYACKLNWAVFPLHSIQDGRCTCLKKDCKSPGKHPRITGGFKSATTDKLKINEWWSNWPVSNIGIATGKINGIIVIDIDPRNGGNQSFEKLKSEYGQLPETVEAVSGGGGKHILFKYPGVSNFRKILMPGIDIKTDGGYIVGAPSLHKSGLEYRWKMSSHPCRVGIAECPEWLVRLIKGKSLDNKKPASYWKDVLKGVGQGERNVVATQLTGYLLRRYIDPYVTWEIIEMWNSRNTPPLSKNELYTIINSVAKQERARRKGMKRNGR
ncbi:DNA primase [Priestia megaterium]|uniref:DNA primase n=1 Tax=Priestia megaterium TaxID=1404 RepID=A0A6H1P242_PRIMG|nr:bifunctional DNA primase/polymerase [Priestia megaterium]QIZ07629.1 DNA primase [Priestia megaterium]